MLNMEKAEEALACFNSVLAIEPNHPDALVKKGAAHGWPDLPKDMPTLADWLVRVLDAVVAAVRRQAGLHRSGNRVTRND